MQKWAIPLLAFVALALWARAQDIVPASVPVVVSMGTPLQSSVRVTAPLAYFTDANAGVEGEFGLPTDDPNHILVWHLNHWRTATLQTTIQP